MLTANIAITIGTQAFSLKKKNQDNFTSVWLDNTTVAGKEVKLTIRHSYEGKPKTVTTSLGVNKVVQVERHVYDLEVTTFDANGFPTVQQSFTHLRNVRGSVAAANVDVVKGLAAFVTSNALDLATWES